jgi:diguanylate cyclase (GGDEF)-like protein
MFDLDGFKDVNDTLGHTTGDRLLIEVGQRMSNAIASRGQVFRLGGDEFIAVIPECGDPLALAAIVGAVLKLLAEPFEVAGNTLHLTGSAGIAMAPVHGTRVDELIANADLALYQAKSDGRGHYRLFVPTLRARAQARRALDLELRRGFAENEFELFFQPQINLTDGRVAGAEALIRWRHPVRGVLAPALFLETLEDSSIAPEVGKWIIATACRKAAVWRADGLPIGRIAVNLFPIQLRSGTLVEHVQDALLEAGLPPEALEIEITENVALDHEQALARLQELHRRGVGIAFDDFGTGFASLNNLTRFPLSRIKIDRSFVARIGAPGKEAAMIRSIIAMAHSLDLEVVAEGVETEVQAAFLRDERCEEAQGFLYARPLPPDEFEAYLRARARKPAHSGSAAAG